MFQQASGRRQVYVRGHGISPPLAPVIRLVRIRAARTSLPTVETD